MQQLVFDGLNLKKRRVRDHSKIILKPRDLEVLIFIADMKFSDLQTLYSLFFQITLSGDVSRSSEGAIRRLQQLVKSGYLSSTYAFDERIKYYLLTKKGYMAIKEYHPEVEVSKPMLKLDHRVFIHDKFVLKARVMLEQKQNTTKWISDRKLRCFKDLSGGLVDANVPDGIYVNSDNKKVALEIEMNVKSKADYRKKIQTYVMMMRSSDVRICVFDKVIYVCAKSFAYAFLKEELKIYGDLFEVVTFSEFFGKETGQIGSQSV